MILTHHGIDSLRRDDFDGTSVTIGGRVYPVVRIGDKYWMAENLDYKFPGITIDATGVPSFPAAWYYNSNEATYGVNGNKFGLLYNYLACAFMEVNKAFPKKWRIPNNDDWTDLTLHASENALKSILYWQNGTGTNESGFNQVPSAYRHDSGGFYEIMQIAILWSKTLYDPSDISRGASRMVFRLNSMQVQSFYNVTYGYSLRLCRDA